MSMLALAGLIAAVLLLLALRQNLLVILGVVTAYAYLVYGDGMVGNIVVDAWDAANREVLLSIPLYILAGNIMSRGAMAPRLIRLMRSVSAPVPGGLPPVPTIRGREPRRSARAWRLSPGRI